MGAPTPAAAALSAEGAVFLQHRCNIDHDGAPPGLQVAEQLGVDAARVFRTLVASAAGELVIAICPVTARLDTKALAAGFGAKSAELVDAATAQRATGYVVGGISPFGQRRRLPTVLDLSATNWDTIFVSGGRRGLEIELAPADIIRVTSARVLALTR